MGGGGKSKDKSQSTQQSESFGYGYNQQDVWGPQATALQNVYGQAAALPGQNQQYLDQAAPYSQVYQSMAQGQLQPQGYMQERIQQGNPYLQNQIDQLGNDLGRFYSEQLLPGIQSGAGLAGGVGGGRQGVAQGIAGRGVAEEFGRQAGNLRYQDVLQGDQLNQQLLTSQGAGAQAGMGGLAQLSQMQMSPYQLMGMLSGISPLALSSGEQFDRSSSSGTSTGKGSGWNFGIDAGVLK